MDITPGAQGEFSPPRVGAEIQQPAAVDVPSSIEQTPGYKITPPAVDGPSTISETPNYSAEQMQTGPDNPTPPVSEAPATPVDLGTPVTVESSSQPGPTISPEQPPTPVGVSSSAAVEGSLTGGEHGALEEAVAQTPETPVLKDEKTENIGNVSAADAIAQAPQPTVEIPQQPVAEPQNPSVAEPQGETVAPQPFVVTPEDDESTTPAEPEVPVTPIAQPPVQPAGEVTAPASGLPQPAVPSEPAAFSPVAPEAPVKPEPDPELRKKIIDIFNKRTEALRRELEEKLGGPAQEETSKGEN